MGQRVTQGTGDIKVTGLRVRNVKTSREHAIDIGGVFEAIGHESRSGLSTGQLDTGPESYVQVDPPSTRTTLADVFACGGRGRTYRQAVTAAGTGAAAIDAERWLAAQEP